jgi:hypothetical protein
MFDQVARNVSVERVEVVPAGLGKAIGRSEGLNFGVAPGKHCFAAHAILELPLMLDDEDPGAAFSHAFGQGGAAQAAARNGNIVRCRHASSSRGIS